MCIAGEDIWHLDCERYKAAAGIRTGQLRRKRKLKKRCSLFVFFFAQILMRVLKILSLGLGRTVSQHLLQLGHVRVMDIMLLPVIMCFSRSCILSTRNIKGVIMNFINCS